MNCKCKNKISPYDICPFCAEKHFSFAFGQFKINNLFFPFRQLIVGELECSKFHLDDNELISRIEYLQNDLNNENFELLSKDFSSFINSKIEENQTILKRRKINSEFVSDVGESEKTFCFAWRLFEECGYESINRNFIIERLIISQIQIYKIDYKVAKEIRDLRHLIEYRRENEIKDKFLKILRIYDSK